MAGNDPDSSWTRATTAGSATRSYNADPQATNLILRRLNLDIIVDQSYEIGFLQQIVDRFPSDPDTVEIADQIPGMEGMDHGAGHEAGHGAGH